MCTTFAVAMLKCNAMNAFGASCNSCSKCGSQNAVALVVVMLLHVLLIRLLELVICLQVVLPLLCFDEEDAELWEEDPQEFVRKVRSGQQQ
jgi:hypothetical protein